MTTEHLTPQDSLTETQSEIVDTHDVISAADKAYLAGEIDWNERELRVEDAALRRATAEREQAEAFDAVVGRKPGLVTKVRRGLSKAILG